MYFSARLRVLLHPVGFVAVAHSACFSDRQQAMQGVVICHRVLESLVSGDHFVKFVPASEGTTREVSRH